MTPPRRIPAAAAIAAIFIAAIAAAICIRMYAHYPAGDELRYAYCFDDPAGRDYFALSSIRPVQDVEDIATSMANHYTGVNGRILVHTVEAAFTALVGLEWFHPLNLAVLVLSIILCARTTAPERRRDLLWWAIVITLWLHAFPEPSRLWVSPNLAPNYLWPSLGTMALLWAVYRDRPVWLQCVLALLAGASNEGFALPLCGAMWCVALFGREERRPPLPTLVALSIGALTLVCAPGNWQRFAANDASGNGLLTGLQLVATLPALWFFAAMAAATAICRGPRTLWARLKDAPVTNTALAMSLMMTIAIHTGLRSLTPLALFATLSGLRLLARMMPQYDLRRARVAAAILLAAVAAHQAWATAEHVERYRQIGAVIDTARARHRGMPPQPKETTYIPYDWTQPPRLLCRYVYDQPPTRFATAYQWRLQGRHYAGIQIHTYLPGDTLEQGPAKAQKQAKNAHSTIKHN